MAHGTLPARSSRRAAHNVESSRTAAVTQGGGRCTVALMVDRPQGEPLTIAVHQATGMIAAQVGCDVVEAFDRLKIRAAAQDMSAHEVALDVLDGVIRFTR